MYWWRNRLPTPVFLGFLFVAKLIKNPPARQETWVWSLGWEAPLEKGKATHSRILAWRIPWTIESDTTERLSLSLSVWQSPKCDRDKERTNAVGKTARIGLANAGLPQTFNLFCFVFKAKQNPASFVQRNKMRMPVICHLLYNHAWVSQHSIQAVSMHMIVCTGAKSRSKEKGLERNNLALINEGETPERNGQLKGWDL